MAFSDVGCGSNACWFRVLVAIDMVLAVLGILSLLSTFVFFSVQYYYLSHKPDGFLLVVGMFLALCVIHFVLCIVAFKAERADRVAYHLWRRWSSYNKWLMILVPSFVILFFLTFLVYITGSRYPGVQETSIDIAETVVALFGIIVRVVGFLMNRGIVLLITKNRYAEKVEAEKELFARASENDVALMGSSCV